MFLALIAVVIGVIALVKAFGASSRIARLEADRDALRTEIAALKRRMERPEPTLAAPPVSPTTSTPAPPTKPTPERVPPTDPTPSTPAPAPKAPSAPPSSSLAPEPPSPPIDWESLLGVKGAAWVGGIALITAAIFFARWTIEQGLVTPEFRFLLMLFAGVGSLVAAELGLRKGYERTANPLSGAGIAILYIAFFAGHVRYELIALPAAFGSMAAVTATACVLAVRYDAFPTAVLGLLGGFVTPVALSSGEDRPVGLFFYVLLLNLGLLAVGTKRRWPGLLELGLAGTLLIQIGWFSEFMSEGNFLVAVVAFFGFGALYLVMPIATKQEDDARVLRTGAIGGVMPFLFSVFLAGSPDYVEQWPLLFGMVGLLDLAILAVACLRGRVGLLLSAAIASGLTLGLWALQGLDADSNASLVGSTIGAIVIFAIPGLARRAALRLGDPDRTARRTIEVAGLMAWAGLAWFGFVMVLLERASPPGPFLGVAAALALLLAERGGHPERVRGALAAGSVVLASLIQIWFLSAVEEGTLASSLAVPVIFSLFMSAFAARSAGQEKDTEAEIAARLAGWVAIFGIYLGLVDPTISASGGPVFAALAAQVLLITWSVLRTDWTIGLPALLGATAFHMLIWQIAYMKPHQHTLAFGVSVLFYLFFLALPLVTPFARWREAVLPWLTSALAGPAFLVPLWHVYKDALGEATIGLLPVAMAMVSAAALREVSGRFAPAPDPLSARLRLRYLALFSAVALWFVAVAIPLQFDRQWITLGWAIEAMALCWLYGRLPHRGLPTFAGVLYALVGVRLLFNPEILGYEERGLPLFNWILYTYGVATACGLVGQALLRRVSSDTYIRRLADAFALNALLLGFWLVNLEILDYFSTGPFIALTGHRGYAVKLALSAGWGLYAVVLLVAGVVKDLKPLRYLSLAFLMLTVAKVFLYDLSELGGIFRVFSFLGLAVGLILVSVFYQRFVFRKQT